MNGWMLKQLMAIKLIKTGPQIIKNWSKTACIQRFNVGFLFYTNKNFFKHVDSHLIVEFVKYSNGT
jgi:hypothetical protein